MSTSLQVTAKIPANAKKGTPQLGPATVTVSSGATAKELIEMFGDEAVRTNAVANWIITLQSGIRAGLVKGETQEQMQARLGSAKMGISNKGVVVDPEKAYTAQFMAATPEDQDKMIKELIKRAAEIKKVK